MEYVYLLTNAHVPSLVKFGFSTRDPRTRAAELSAPTGVPGKWEVHHFWEVEDGHGVEQEVFRRLAAKRLEKQEFLRMRAPEAVEQISIVIGVVGTNPTQRAREAAERKAQAAREAKARTEQELASMQAACAEQERRLHEVRSAIQAAVQPIEAVTEKRDLRVMYAVSLAAYILFWYLNRDKPGIEPYVTAAVAVVACFLCPIIPIISVFLMPRREQDPRVGKVRAEVLAAHGFHSEEALKQAEKSLDELKQEARHLEAQHMKELRASFPVRQKVRRRARRH